MHSKPRIVITMGDPAGIGPEIIAKAFEAADLFSCCRPVVVGDAGVVKKAAAGLGLQLRVNEIASIAEAGLNPGTIDVLTLDPIDLTAHRWGSPDSTSGRMAVAYIKHAAALAVRGETDAIVTAPISKAMMNAAGFRYAGHTELLAELTGARDYGMLFVGGGLYVILATIHLALKNVPAQITADGILKMLRLARHAMIDFGIEHPRIGVAALNPHAGEGGLFGSEEQDQIMPAVLAARAEGIDASDPMPADTLFYKARNKQYDIVLAMYHDQGLAPLKMLAFGNAVNVTVGLPIIRTSVDHGTAYDIAGKGCADPASLQEATRIAASMASRRIRAREGQ